jgi:ribosome biogenesis protein MAK21
MLIAQIMQSGTLEDKISALTLAIQESPVHGMKSFSNLLGLSKKKSRNHALQALEALCDLFSQGEVLPADRKLRFFAMQPELVEAAQNLRAWSPTDDLPGGLQNIHLLSWIFEDWLKTNYFELIKVLETWCNDELDFARSRCLNYVSQLLKEKPEQEENLLRLLVNKLGDTSNKVASKASYLLLQLEQAHPNMKSTIVNAIESDILFRPGQSIHAKYYAVITLNQTVLSGKEPDQALARKLLDIYFSLFKPVLNSRKPAEHTDLAAQKKGEKLNRKAQARAKEQEEAERLGEEASEKMLSQILTGVNRAYPFAAVDSTTFDTYLETLYKITHSSNFNTNLQALILIQMVLASKPVNVDRYYRILYDSLLDSRLVTSSKHVMYLNLLYRSMKSDLSLKRVQAFIKRILQSLTLHEPPFMCSALYLVAVMFKLNPSVLSMLSDPEADDEDEEEHYVDVPEDGVEVPQATKSKTPKPINQLYDSKKRDPLYTSADCSCLWDIIPLLSHFHPSVSLFATRILLNGLTPPKPDPSLHTLSHFLDRFIYRNAKTKNPGLRGNSIMQPLANTNAVDLLLLKGEVSSREDRFNTEAFWGQKVEDVPVDEVFFHQYFSKVGKTKKKTKVDKRDAGSDAEEDEIWKALVDSRPDIEGEEDEDDDMDGLEELMGDDSDEVDDMDIDDDGLGEDDVEINLDSDEDEDIVVNGDDSDGELNIADIESDEDAMLGSDDDVPAEVPEPVEEETEDKKEKKNKRKKFKNLPTFASMEDYAHLLGDDDD